MSAATDADTSPLTGEQLLEIARAAAGSTGCPACAALVCPGWESLPAGFDTGVLRALGTLRQGEDEPGWDEFHPDGTRLWSPDAPIAPRHHPYHRCDVAACSGCGRAFLRYTEFGGYYVDQRVRALDPALVRTDA
ncbi:hypothetical protein ACPOLB_12080 [Rubrivivax sp. RP6-9]|uniref:hypothetical protein n=1 Tax=Rubrivivax sp. RP6-9 TaxID=3415750 RepID=UPI003CC51C70